MYSGAAGFLWTPGARKDPVEADLWAQRASTICLKRNEPRSRSSKSFTYINTKGAKALLWLDGTMTHGRRDGRIRRGLQCCVSWGETTRTRIVPLALDWIKLETRFDLRVARRLKEVRWIGARAAAGLALE